MSHFSNRLLAAFLAGDLDAARSLLAQQPPYIGVVAHPCLRDFMEQNDGKCRRKKQLAIAELLLSADVRAFRNAVLEDRVDDLRAQLATKPALIHAEFTAGHGLSQAIHHFCGVKMGGLLLDAGADINAQTTVRFNGDTPLAMQVRRGDVDCVRFLLERGANPNVLPGMHITSAAMSVLIPLLLDHGWDIHVGNQLLHDAKLGHGWRVQHWIEFGVDPNLQTDEGAGALHLLASHGTGRDAIRALVNAGADINARDCVGRTPLEIAKVAGQKSAMRELMILGAHQ